MSISRLCGISCAILATSSGVPLTAQMPASAEGGYVTQFSPPKRSLKGVVNLPEPSRVLPDSTGCSSEQAEMAGRLAGRRVQCFGSVDVAEDSYVMTENWLATESDPGRIQVIRNGAPIGSVAAMTGGWISGIITRSGNFEILSIAPRGGVAKDSLPYLRYRVGNGRLNMIPGKMFVAGKSPVDEDRRRLLAAAAPAAAYPAAPAAPASVRAPARAAAPAPNTGANPHCAFARWSGDIPNVADLFLCDEARAIETFSRGARFVLKPDAVRFADGKYLVRMTLRPSATSASINRMQKKFNWNDWAYATQNIASSEVFCAFNSNPVPQGQSGVVFGKLDTYAGKRIILVCSRG